MAELPGDLIFCFACGALMSRFECGALLLRDDLDRHLDWHVHVAPVRTAGAQVARPASLSRQSYGRSATDLRALHGSCATGEPLATDCLDAVPDDG